jgi:hypothetical protein
MPGQDKIFVGGVWKTLGSGGGGSGGSGTMPLGYNIGVYVSYKDADEIYVEPGNIDVDGTDVSVTTRTAHTMTSMVNASEDFHYIYLSTAGAITDATTEPAWSDAKFGWYNGTTRCIGVVWVPSATPAILSKFSCNVNHEYIYDGIINELVTNGNPNGDWQDLATASTYSPIIANAAMVFARGSDVGANMSVFVSAFESKSYYDGIGMNGYGHVGVRGWIPLQASRDLSWYGDDDDDNAFIVRITGYRISA